MDITRGGYVISGSMKGERPAGTVQEALSGERSLEKLFTKEQRAFFEEFATTRPGWMDLKALGPINVIKVKFAAPGVSEDITVEQWHYPGQVPSVELSTKSAPKDAVQLGIEARRFLREHGLSATGQQEPKTRKALEFLVGRMKGPAPTRTRSSAAGHGRRRTARTARKAPAKTTTTR
jgi:hypothetical protein